MPGHAQPDLSGLARLAQSPDGELRPLLLRIQAASFASAPSRDRDTVLRFEALALGLIPLVTSDVLAEVAARLRQVPEVPLSVLALLAERLNPGLDAGEDAAGDLARAHDLGPRALGDLLALQRDDIDLALAGNDRIVLDGHALACLVDRGRRRGRLARRLLARPEPGPLDRAALYGFADEARRDRIRHDLGLSTGRGGLPPLTAAGRTVILEAAAGQGSGRLLALVADALATEDLVAFDLDSGGGREMLVLALIALGLEPDDCIQVCLTFDPRIACSVEAVFRLAEVARSTARPVAARIVACALPSVQGRTAGQHRPVHDDRPGFDRARRGFDPPQASRPDALKTVRARPRAGSRGTSARPDHRSRATTGLDRT